MFCILPSLAEIEQSLTMSLQAYKILNLKNFHVCIHILLRFLDGNHLCIESLIQLDSKK